MALELIPDTTIREQVVELDSVKFAYASVTVTEKHDLGFTRWVVRFHLETRKAPQQSRHILETHHSVEEAVAMFDYYVRQLPRLVEAFESAHAGRKVSA